MGKTYIDERGKKDKCKETITLIFNSKLVRTKIYRLKKEVSHVRRYSNSFGTLVSDKTFCKMKYLKE